MTKNKIDLSEIPFIAAAALLGGFIGLFGYFNSRITFGYSYAAMLSLILFGIIIGLTIGLIVSKKFKVHWFIKLLSYLIIIGIILFILVIFELSNACGSSC